MWASRPRLCVANTRLCVGKMMCLVSAIAVVGCSVKVGCVCTYVCRREYARHHSTVNGSYP